MEKVRKLTDEELNKISGGGMLEDGYLCKCKHCGQFYIGLGKVKKCDQCGTDFEENPELLEILS